MTTGLVVVLSQPRPNQTLRQRFHHTVGAVSTQYGAVPRMITVTQIILGGGKYVLSHSLALSNQAPTVVIT